MSDSELQVYDGRNSITTVDMFDSSKTKSALLLATELAASTVIPYAYQGKPANVMVALMRSARLGVDPFAYMETTYPVGGRTGHEAKFIIALINNSKKFKTPLLYRFEGETKRGPDGLIDARLSDRKCTAYAILRETDIEVAQSCDLKMAFREGWALKAPKDAKLSVRNNKWQSMTDEMLQYRAAAFFGKMYCPELTMGLNTRDELEDNISDGEAVEITETGKDIFEKGVEIDTAADPVIDPAMEVHLTKKGVEQVVAAMAEIVETTPQQEPAQVAQPVTDQTPATVAEAVTTVPAARVEEHGVLPAAPPQSADEFKEWFCRRFSAEMKTIDIFLMGKKWLSMGETADEKPVAWFANILSMWAKFLPAYEKFREERKNGGFSL